jgi:hypothetical protein
VVVAVETEYRLNREARRLEWTQRVVAVMLPFFFAFPRRFGPLAVAAGVLSALIVAYVLWRRIDLPNVVRLDGDRLHFVRRGRVVAAIPIRELRSITDSDNPRYLTWKGSDVRVSTLSGLERQRELFEELPRRAPNLRSLPAIRPYP